MNNYRVSEIYMSDKSGIKKVEDLLNEEGLSLDKNLDYICGIYDSNRELVATGSCYYDTLRCFAVRSDHQGEGLLNTIITHLINYQFQRGHSRLFIYTKVDSANFFNDLGFFEIARVEDKLVFMENSSQAFPNFLKELAETRREGNSSAIVMNANPFTVGHRYLIEKAASESDQVHLFILSEDVGPIPFSVRKKLLIEGTKDIDNLIIHESGPYIISNATFPAYFLRDEEEVIKSQARLDITIFKKIAEVLGIKKRFVGEEPYSLVTKMYNDIMESELAKSGIECKVIPRKEFAGQAISASNVRKLLQEGDLNALKGLLPQPCIDYFKSPQAKEVLDRIKACDDLIHY